MGLITRDGPEPNWLAGDMGCQATSPEEPGEGTEPAMACWLSAEHEGEEHYDNVDRLWWRLDPSAERSGPLTGEEQQGQPDA